MQPSGSTIVYGKDGWRGTLVSPSPSALPDTSQVVVQLDRGVQLLVRKNISTLLQVLRLWGVVLLANVIGAYMFAWVISNTSMFDADVRQMIALLGQEALTLPFWTIVLRALFAGWLIALMVWLLPFAETGRVTIIILVTYVIGLGGFAHIIAGSVKTFAAVMMGAASWSAFWGKFFVPALLGNITGGVTMVAAIGYAQIASERRLTYADTSDG